MPTAEEGGGDGQGSPHGGSGDGQRCPNAAGARDAGQGWPSVAGAKDGTGATGGSGWKTSESRVTKKLNKDGQSGMWFSQTLPTTTNNSDKQ